MEEFTRDRKPTAAHRALAKLPLRTFWTTNYDTLIEKSLIDLRVPIDVKRSQEQLSRHIPGRTATVFKMHGDADSPQEAVLVRDDYEEYSRTRELFTDVFTADLLMKTFVFIGVSFSDPNLTFLLGRLRSIYHGARKEHFWIVKRPDGIDNDAGLFDLRVDDLRRYGIRTIVVNDYLDLAPLLGNAGSEYIRLRRINSIFFSGSVRDSNPRAQEIRQFAQALAKRLVYTERVIITGLGRGIGTWVTTAALEALYETAEFAIRPDRVRALPFPIGAAENTEARTIHRKRLISDAGFSIFIAGRGDSGGNRVEEPSGTVQEFNIARQLGSYVLPIGVTGSDSRELWHRAYNERAAIFGIKTKKIEPLLMRLNDDAIPLLSQVDNVIEIIDSLQ